MLDNGTYCPLGRFVPWDVLSMGRFVPWDVLSMGRLVPWDVLSLRRFVPWYVLSWDVVYVHRNKNLPVMKMYVKNTITGNILTVCNFNNYSLFNKDCVRITHERRIHKEEKAKVVTASRGTELLRFLVEQGMDYCAPGRFEE